MTIVQLEYLIAVVNHQSFSAASEECCVTQPSLSTQIKNLEIELGVTLINRSVKGFQLTEVGKKVVERAKVAIAEFYTIKEEVQNMQGGYSGKLRIAIIPSIAPYLVHKLAPRFTKQYRDIELEISEMITSDIIVALERDKIDIAILAGGFTPKNSIEEQALYKDNFWLYCSPQNRLLEHKEIDIKQLDLSKLMLLSDGHCLRTQVLEFCGAKADKKDRFRFESGSLETLMRLVDSTDGVTIVPEMALESLSKERMKQVKPFVSSEAYRFISVATSKNFIKRSAYKALCDLLQKIHQSDKLEREMLIKD